MVYHVQSAGILEGYVLEYCAVRRSFTEIWLAIAKVAWDRYDEFINGVSSQCRHSRHDLLISL